MSRKSSWIVIAVIFLLAVVLFLTRGAWQPWLFGYLQPRQVKLETIKLVVDLLNGLLGLIPALVALWLVFSPQRAGEKQSPDDPLPQTRVEKILNDYSQEN